MPRLASRLDAPRGRRPARVPLRCCLPPHQPPCRPRSCSCCRCWLSLTCCTRSFGSSRPPSERCAAKRTTPSPSSPASPRRSRVRVACARGAAWRRQLTRWLTHAAPPHANSAAIHGGLLLGDALCAAQPAGSAARALGARHRAPLRGPGEPSLPMRRRSPVIICHRRPLTRRLPIAQVLNAGIYRAIGINGVRAAPPRPLPAAPPRQRQGCANVPLLRSAEPPAARCAGCRTQVYYGFKLGHKIPWVRARRGGASRAAPQQPALLAVPAAPRSRPARPGRSHACRWRRAGDGLSVQPRLLTPAVRGRDALALGPRGAAVGAAAAACAAARVRRLDGAVRLHRRHRVALLSAGRWRPRAPCSASCDEHAQACYATRRR